MRNNEKEKTTRKMQETNFSKISTWSVLVLAAIGIATSFILWCRKDVLPATNDTSAQKQADSIFVTELPTTPQPIQTTVKTSNPKNYLIRKENTKLAERFWNCDAQFERNTPRKASFQDFLLRLEMTNDQDGDNSPERMPNSIFALKHKPKAYNANLPQNADLCLILKAWHLYETDKNAIHFFIDNNIDLKYSDWAEGYRLVGSGDALALAKTADEDYSESSFRSYMANVLSNMSTSSFLKNLRKVRIENTAPGDILYHQGQEKIACVVDVMHDQNSRLRIMYARFFGHETGIIRNNDEAGSPWFTIELGGTEPFPIYTPNCTFSSNDVWRLN